MKKKIQPPRPKQLISTEELENAFKKYLAEKSKKANNEYDIEDFKCPLSQTIAFDPVKHPEYSGIYERHQLEEHFLAQDRKQSAQDKSRKRTNPYPVVDVSGIGIYQPVQDKKDMITEFLKAHPSGLEIKHAEDPEVRELVSRLDLDQFKKLIIVNGANIQTGQTLPHYVCIQTHNPERKTLMLKYMLDTGYDFFTPSKTKHTPLSRLILSRDLKNIDNMLRDQRIYNNLVNLYYQLKLTHPSDITTLEKCIEAIKNHADLNTHGKKYLRIIQSYCKIALACQEYSPLEDPNAPQPLDEDFIRRVQRGEFDRPQGEEEEEDVEDEEVEIVAPPPTKSATKPTKFRSPTPNS